MSSTITCEVRRAQDPAEVAAALALRYAVFCVEQGVPEHEERDGRDHQGLHLVALTNGRLVGTCRLVIVGETVQFSRLAVEASVRRCGVATALLREAEREALAAGAGRMVLHAQVYARELYARAGYHPRGREFVEAGIRHVAMEKRL